ncbi:MAG: glycosyltransferase, partial [Nitrososphaeraceae archaeon]
MINRLSVIIPTRNRAQSLKVLLDSLESADNPDSVGVEIMVVNNGSTDETAERLEEEATRPRRYALTVLQAQHPGKAHALNLGLAKADGDVLIILDDDVSVDRRCLAEHVLAHRQTFFAAIQGRVLPGKDPEGRTADPMRLREYNIPRIDYGDQVIEIRGLTGTNMSFTREVQKRVGYFDIRLGPGASGFSEDTEYSIRIRKAGFKIGYTPNAIVYHELNPGRYGRDYNRMVE